MFGSGQPASRDVKEPRALHGPPENRYAPRAWSPPPQPQQQLQAQPLAKPQAQPQPEQQARSQVHTQLRTEPLPPQQPQHQPQRPPQHPPQHPPRHQPQQQQDQPQQHQHQRQRELSLPPQHQQQQQPALTSARRSSSSEQAECANRSSSNVPWPPIKADSADSSEYLPPAKRARPTREPGELSSLREFSQASSSAAVLRLLPQPPQAAEAFVYSQALSKLVSLQVEGGEMVSSETLVLLSDGMVGRVDEMSLDSIAEAVVAWSKISHDPGQVLQELDELLPEILKLADKTARGNPRGNSDRVRSAFLVSYPRLADFACHRLPARLVRALDLEAAALLGMSDLGPQRASCRIVFSSYPPPSEEEVRRVFQRYGAVHNVVLGAGRGSVQYESAEHAEAALADAQSIRVCGRIPRLSRSRPEVYDKPFPATRRDNLRAGLTWFACVQRGRVAPDPALFRHAQQLVEFHLNDMDQRDLERVLPGLAGIVGLLGGCVEPERAPEERLLARFEETVERKLGGLNCLGVARVLSGYAAFGRRVPARLLELMQQRIVEHQARCGSYRAGNFVGNQRQREDETEAAVMLLEGFARSRHLYQEPPRDTIPRACLEQIVMLAESLNDDRLVGALWALARLGFRPDVQSLRHLEAALLARAHRLSAAQAVTAAWAVAANGLQIAPPTATALCAVLRKRVSGMAPQDAVSALWTVVFLRWADKPLMDALCAAILASLRELQLQPHQLATVLLALGQAQYKPGAALMAPLSAAALKAATDMRPGDLVNAVWGWARLQYQPSIDARSVLQDALQRHYAHLNPEQVANATAACRYLGLLLIDRPVALP
jgi:hypothetical protein